jgi:hypothetical protein
LLAKRPFLPASFLQRLRFALSGLFILGFFFLCFTSVTGFTCYIVFFKTGKFAPTPVTFKISSAVRRITPQYTKVASPKGRNTSDESAEIIPLQQAAPRKPSESDQSISHLRLLNLPTAEAEEPVLESPPHLSFNDENQFANVSDSSDNVPLLVEFS